MRAVLRACVCVCMCVSVSVSVSVFVCVIDETVVCVSDRQEQILCEINSDFDDQKIDLRTYL